MNDRGIRLKLTVWLAALGLEGNAFSFARASSFFLVNFTVAKLAIYAAPLVIAALATPNVYGTIELAQSIGLLLTSFVIGAPLAGVTQTYLVRGDQEVADQLSLVSLLFCGLTLLVTLGAWLANVPAIPLLVIAAFASLVLHNTAATWFRMLGLRNQTAWVDGTALLLAVAVVLAALLVTGTTAMSSVTLGYVSIAAVGTVASVLLFLKTKRGALKERLIASTRIGIPMVIVGTLATWLGVGGRITVGFLDASNVAAYGVAFRIAGLALGVHQLVMTALFARIYRAKTRQADAIMSLFFVGVGLLSAVIALSGAFISEWFTFKALDVRGEAVFVQILPLACLQTFYWIGYAMLQLRINRSGLAKRSIVPTIVLTLGGAGAIFGTAKLFSAGIVLVSFMIAVHGAAYFFLNAAILAAYGRLPHRRMTAVGLIGGTGLLALAGLRILA